MRNTEQQRKKRLIFCAALVLLLLLTALFAKQLCPYDPYEQNYSISLLPPCPEHPFGTDRFGRDLFSRVLIGSKTSIVSAIVLVTVIAAAGMMAGMFCGYFGGPLDTAVMRVADICLAFPGIVFALAVASVLQGGMMAILLSLGVIHWPKYARVARGQTRSMKQEEYIAAARLSGCRTTKLLLRHIFPNIMSPILVTAMLDIGTMMMEIAALSYLGLGVQPPAAEWGSMMSAGRSMLQLYPWVVLAPGCAMVVCVVLFNLFGEALRDYWNQKGQ